MSDAKHKAMGHFVSASVKGHVCTICGSPATHKIGEEIPHDDPSMKSVGGSLSRQRHNFTEWVCCECFRKLFGPAVFCESAKARN